MTVFPPRGHTRLLAAAGGLATLATTVVFVRAFGLRNPMALAWSIPFVGGYIAGVIAVAARPEHPAARRLLVFGCAAPAFIGAAVALSVGFDAHGRQWWLGPGNVAVQYLGLVMGASMVALLAYFPNSHYTGPYERQVVRTVALLALFVPVGLLLSTRHIHPAWVFAWGDPADPATASFPDIRSPLYVAALRWLGSPLRGYHDAAGLGVPVIAVVLAGLRYRRLAPAERGQLRWPVYGLSVLVLAPLADVLQRVGVLTAPIADPIKIVTLAALPASVCVALVKPDLFDVDRVMRRSLVYVPLWIAITGAYVGVAAALGVAAASIGIQLAIVVTIAVTVLAEPARRFFARRAATWAYGESLSGEELVRRLGGTLAHTMDLDQLLVEVATIAQEGLGARWVRIRVVDAVPAHVGEPAGGAPALSARLSHAGEELGAIECGPRVRGRPRASDTEAVQTLARQTALAVHNARLANALALRLDELKARTAELAASRSRIVAAHETARRQIERDIHDGAQQELVALIAGIGLARSQLGRDPTHLDEMLARLQGEVAQVLGNVRDLAAGIHPSVLSDHGLVEAIEIRTSRLPLEVTVECPPRLRRKRFGDQVEGAAYFFVSEALANILKHAGAGTARVRITGSARELRVEVTDDGVGFDADAISSNGLRGLADRVEALGGEVGVQSAPGTGTRLSARLPLGSHASG